MRRDRCVRAVVRLDRDARLQEGTFELAIRTSTEVRSADAVRAGPRLLVSDRPLCAPADGVLELLHRDPATRRALLSAGSGGFSLETYGLPRPRF